MMASLLRRRGAVMVLLALALWSALLAPAAAQNIDGGRSELPGMRQDMFDRAQKAKRGGNQRMGKGPPDCPKSDKMSPFYGLAFVGTDVYVKMNSTEDRCVKLESIAGANFTVLANASRTCGPAGEIKKRIAEDLSAVFFQGNLDWVKSENDTITVVTEEGTFDLEVNEAKGVAQTDCWARGCGCEQAANPKGRAMLYTMLAIAVGGLIWDSARVSLASWRNEKPPKHVLCKKDHKVEEGKNSLRHTCDVCGKLGTQYCCSQKCPYDLCTPCYKDAKKKTKAALDKWYEKHPEEKAKDEEKKKEKKKKTDGGDSEKEGKAESEAESTTKAESETKSETEKADSKAESSKGDETEEQDE